MVLLPIIDGGTGNVFRLYAVVKSCLKLSRDIKVAFRVLKKGELGSHGYVYGRGGEGCWFKVRSNNWNGGWFLVMH